MPTCTLAACRRHNTAYCDTSRSDFKYVNEELVGRNGLVAKWRSELVLAMASDRWVRVGRHGQEGRWSAGVEGKALGGKAPCEGGARAWQCRQRQPSACLSRGGVLSCRWACVADIDAPSDKQCNNQSLGLEGVHNDIHYVLGGEQEMARCCCDAACCGYARPAHADIAAR